LANVPETLDRWLAFRGTGAELLRMDWFKLFE
jgi:hypothetical protein